VANRLHGNLWRAAQTLFNEGVIGDETDEQLLERFVTAHRELGEMAFEALVDRHGPMVLRICRTILPGKDDAEDAFQATFLVLARRAASIRSRSSLASWLHAVARRVASSARSAAARRREHERNAADLADQCVPEPRSDDLAQVIHEEIDQLPERFRTPIVLCYMQGLTEGQAARRLGRPLGTIRSRLTRGKQRLRCQLIRRGLAPASVVLVGARAGSAAPVIVHSALVRLTVESAMHFAMASATTAGTVSAAAALAEEFLGSMLMARFKNIAMAALVALGIATVGAFALESPGEHAPPASDSKQELLNLSRAWAGALAKSEVGTMDRLAAHEMVGTDPVGGLWDKPKYLEYVKVNSLRIDSCEFKEGKVHLYGDAAAVTGLIVSNANSTRWPYCVERSTMTWIKRHGAWQCVAWQSMVIAGPTGW
jgi:RNA polymerase sigma factor (sigma-70 family)